jgi:hypothetical protein
MKLGGEGMLWQVTNHLPTRADYIEMLGKARAATAHAIDEAKKAGNPVLLLQYELQLADWDKLIGRLRDNPT